MDNINAIRAGIFFVAGIASILFKERLNKFKNHLLEKLHMKSRIKDKRKAYVYTGIILIIISMILLTYAITH